MKSCRGQILPLGIVLIFFLALFWVTLLNVSKLIKDRVQMQIAADTSVQTACAFRARALNIAGVLNGWLGTPVLGIGTPLASWWVAPPHTFDERVVKQSIDEFKDAYAEAEKYMSGEQKLSYGIFLKPILRSLLAQIALSYDTHPPQDPNYALKQKDFIEAVIQVQENYVKSYAGGYAKYKAREVAQAQGADDIYIPTGSLSVRLHRNQGLVWYLGTLHLWCLAVSQYGFPLPFTPVNSDDDVTKRWYERGPDFDHQSMRLYAYRRPDSPFNGPFPMGKRLLNIGMPYLYTVAAARVYNPDGPMFPKIGETDGFYAGRAVVKAYDDASNGWHSQLVPIGSLYAH